MVSWLVALCLSASAQTLPELESAAPAVYPSEAREQGIEATVILELLIDEEGRVVEAEVVEGAGQGFDEAALNAIRDFVFKPATDAKGRPAEAQIRYAYRFTLEAAPQLSAEGLVRQAGTREPLGGVGLTLDGPGGVRRTVQTGDDGTFSVAGLAPGQWMATVRRGDLEQQQVAFEVKEGSVAQLVLWPKVLRPWDAEQADLEIEVVGRAAAPEVTERVLSSEEIRYLPGTGGDIVRVVQNLPGVARPPFNIGQLLVRGTAPEDSAYYLDGAQIPIVFHFAGFSTVLNNEIVEEVGFLPGNYSARYGRTQGGVVDLRTSIRLPERNSGFVEVDLFQTTAFVEQRVSDRTAVTFSGRRSYVDAVLNPVLNSAGAAAIRAPRYYDAQARVLHESDTLGSLDAMIFLSDDRFRVVGDEADSDEVQIGLNTSFQKLKLGQRKQLGNGWSQELSFVGGPEVQAFQIAPDGDAYERSLLGSLRVEWAREYQEDNPLAWRVGLDAQGRRFDFKYDVPAFGALEEDVIWSLSPAMYVEPSVKTGPLEVITGMRVDPLYTSVDYTGFALDPRLASRLTLGSTDLKASWGQFSQFPGLRQVAETQDGNPDLLAARSLQASLGVEQRLRGGITAEVTGFHNWLDRQVVGREDAFRFFSGPPPGGPLDTDPYANDGTGRIFGVESLVRLETKRTIGWLSATVSRSTRVKRPDQERVLFEYDQPLILTALLSHQLPKNWRLGARYRFGSGNPYTPVVNRYWDLQSRTFLPVYGEPSSGRLPPFWQLDLRIDKDYTFKKWKLTTYLDLQNATNRQNVDVMAWTYDYEEEEPLAGLPLIPAFGLRGEW